ncbi:hypothetical protein, partial [Chitinophaga sp.]|uniref:hypothetical protein n=1 Tax=Chitinophaga sp. TaxID=1869181 RepID=UPI002C419106
VFIETGLPKFIKRKIWGKDSYKHRLKPLDCQMCMGWWMGIIISVFFGKNWPETICIGGISAVLAVIITKYLNK